MCSGIQFEASALTGREYDVSAQSHCIGWIDAGREERYRMDEWVVDSYKRGKVDG